ncbi:MAG: RNA methyltransferase [Deltaproteobacteria bacterium]|jgi:23S rRNA (guanosine2251-2'-O)-methyltransferase|nr:RNA methyltransferase [Deltaproteobacteria bacterium]
MTAPKKRPFPKRPAGSDRQKSAQKPSPKNFPKPNPKNSQEAHKQAPKRPAVERAFKSSREKDGSNPDLILGFNPVRAALMARPQDALKLYVSESRRESKELIEILGLAAQLDLELNFAKRDRLDGFGERHQGLVLLAKTKAEPSLGEFLKTCPMGAPGLIVFLDHLEDPHNFGALIRSAAAFGALGVVYPKDRSAPLNPYAKMASAGASEVLPLIKVVNPARAVLEMKSQGFWVVAAEAGLGQDVLGFDFPSRTVLVLGSEGHGLSRSLLAQADHLVHINLPSPLIGSLNVSNAGAIFIHAYGASQARLAGPASQANPAQKTGPARRSWKNPKI